MSFAEFFFLKLGMQLPHNLAIEIFCSYLREMKKKMLVKRAVHKYSYFLYFLKSHRLETAQIFLSKDMVKQTVAHISHGILLWNKIKC